jgi:hypothetical protein
MVDRTDGLPGGAAQAQPLALTLDAFAWEALLQESAALGVPVDELAVFAILYYLADLDSGRVARRIPRSDPTSDQEAGL